MVLWWLATTMAQAEEPVCAKIPDLTESAWASFNDAELEAAKATLAQANDAISCQAQPVSTEELMAMHQLDALVSLAQEDRKGAVYATIRMVTIDPEIKPGDELGPELQDLHATWVTRLSESTVSVKVKGAGAAWLDGREILGGQQLSGLAGEHVVQVRNNDGSFSSRVQDLATDLVLMTGGETPGGDPPPDEPDKPIKPDKPPKPPREKTGPKVSIPLIVVGLVSAAGGGALVALAAQNEQRFLADPYSADQYTDPKSGIVCAAGEECYATARDEQIRIDANRIRATYIGGYAGGVTGAALFTSGLLIRPDPTSGSVTVGVRGRW